MQRLRHLRRFLPIIRRRQHRRLRTDLIQQVKQRRLLYPQQIINRIHQTVRRRSRQVHPLGRNLKPQHRLIQLRHLRFRIRRLYLKVRIHQVRCQVRPPFLQRIIRVLIFTIQPRRMVTKEQHHRRLVQLCHLRQEIRQILIPIMNTLPMHRQIIIIPSPWPKINFGVLWHPIRPVILHRHQPNHLPRLFVPQLRQNLLISRPVVRIIALPLVFPKLHSIFIHKLIKAQNRIHDIPLIHSPIVSVQPPSLQPKQFRPAGRR